MHVLSSHGCQDTMCPLQYAYSCRRYRKTLMWTQICWHTLHTFGCLNWIGDAGNCCVDSTGKMWVSYDRWVWNGAWRFQYSGDSVLSISDCGAQITERFFLPYLVQNCKHLRRSWFVERNSLAEVYCCYYFSFWATVSKIVHPILSDHCLSVCLSVLSVTLVYCGQTVDGSRWNLAWW